MTWTAISAILAALGLIFYQWVKSRNASEVGLSQKNDALEDLAAEKRAREQAEDEEFAKELAASGDTERVIGFLRGSLSRTRGSN